MVRGSAMVENTSLADASIRCDQCVRENLSTVTNRCCSTHRSTRMYQGGDLDSVISKMLMYDHPLSPSCAADCRNAAKRMRGRLIIGPAFQSFKTEI